MWLEVVAVWLTDWWIKDCVASLMYVGRMYVGRFENPETEIVRRVIYV
jgi:hypothetical protein